MMVSWLRAVCLAVVLGLFAGGEAQAKWLRAETQRFVIYSDGDERSLREYAAMLEDFDIVLRHYHNVDQRIAPPRKLDIYLVRDFAGLRRARSGVGSAVAGIYSSGLDDIFAVAIARKEDRAPPVGSRISRSNGNDHAHILFHEYTHHFQAQYATFPYPAWMSEGWAEYFAPTEIEDTRVVVGGFDKGRAYQLGLPWMPFEDLLRSQGVSKQWAEFYAQSWLLTHYLYSEPARRQQLESFKAAISQGVEPVTAMQTATGMDLKTLTKTLRDYTRGGLITMVLTRAKLADVPMTVTQLPPSADDLLLERQQLMNGLEEKERPALLNTIRSRAAKYPGDPLAQRVLAQAEIFYGDRAAGERILQGHLAAHPDDAEALRLMARSRILTAYALEDDAPKAKVLAEARPYLVKANKLELDNYQTYYYFALTRMFDADYPSKNTMELLTLAHKIAPQVEEITFQAAQAHVFRKEFDSARPMLTMLANHPHGGEMADAAKAMLAEIPTKPN